MFAIVQLSLIVIFILIIISIIKGAPYLPVDNKTLNTIVRLSKVKGSETIADLGSGDARVVLAFSDLVSQIDGYEINPILVGISKIKILFKNKKNCKVYWKNFWNVDCGKYDIIVVFGISYIMADLEKKLVKEMKRNSKIISYSYSFPNLNEVKEESGVYLYKM